MNYIIKVGSFSNHEVIRDQQEVLDSAGEGLNVQECDCLWAVVSVHPLDGAEIIDDGFRTCEDAKKRYPEAIIPANEETCSHVA